MESNNIPDRFPVIAVVGPTATGKTSVSIRLAKRLGGEIINLDSVQIYKGLDIGSAKPSREEMSGIVHHLIDIRQPWEPMDAASFIRLASRRIELLLKQGKIPVLVGGTGFYLKSLEQGLSVLPCAIPAFRKYLKEVIRQKGHKGVYSLLKSMDPKRVENIHPKDTYRLTRAFEIYLSHGPKRDETQEQGKKIGGFIERGIRIFKIGLMMERSALYRLIDRRVDEMIEKGFIKEVSRLLEQGLDPRLKSLQSIGYRHIISYLLKESGLSQAIFEMKRDTRRYAKRQITWFKKDPEIRWFHPKRLLESEDIWKAVN